MNTSVFHAEVDGRPALCMFRFNEAGGYFCWQQYNQEVDHVAIETVKVLPMEHDSILMVNGHVVTMDRLQASAAAMMTHERGVRVEWL